MNKPVLSIVILSALRQVCTRKCIDSIDYFTASDHEVIVVDMGLDKDIIEWLREESGKRHNFNIKYS